MSDHFQEYTAFIIERHKINRKRRLGEAPPWTTDPILQTYKFTNVYRELDKGTVFYIDKIGSLKDPHEIFFQTVAYRMINSIPSWEHLGLTYGAWPTHAANLPKLFKELQSKQGFIWNNAYMIMGNIPKGADKRVYLMQFLNDLWSATPDLVSAMLHAKGGKEAWEKLMGMDYVGPFIAYEIYSDLVYTPILGRFGENEFVNIGPGAKGGVEYVFGHKVAPRDAVAALKGLQMRVNAVLPKDWHPMSLRNIEHSLCEFRKYLKIKNGGHHTKYRA